MDMDLIKSKRKERNGRQVEEKEKRMQLEIPVSVEEEILSKLPVKSLARFRCVSKRWAACYFQTSSYFIAKHYRNNKNKPLNLIFFGGGLDSYFTLVYGPCNGLLCIFDITKQSLSLWNPSTREYKLIPKTTVPSLHPSKGNYLASFTFGFGYDSITDDYKVVRFRVFDQISQAELYSLKTDSWKQISAPHPCPRPRNLLRMFSFNNYVNGFYYWQAVSPDKRNIILSFNMANEKFSTLPCPIDTNVHVRGELELLDFNSLLGAAVFWPEKFLDLWVMMNGSWTKQFSIDHFPGLGMPLGFSKIGEIYFKSSNKELALFDPVTKEVKNLGVRVNRNSLKLIAYDESLVSINGTSDEEHLIRQPAGNVQIDSENNNDSKPRIYML